MCVYNYFYMLLTIITHINFLLYHQIACCCCYWFDSANWFNWNKEANSIYNHPLGFYFHFYSKLIIHKVENYRSIKCAYCGWGMQLKLLSNGSSFFALNDLGFIVMDNKIVRCCCGRRKKRSSALFVALAVHWFDLYNLTTLTNSSIICSDEFLVLFDSLLIYNINC